MRWIMAGAAGVSAIALGVWWTQSTAEAGILPYKDADSVARGVEIYAENCAACHGADLEGEPQWKRRKDTGRMPAPPHDESGHTWHHADDVLFAITKFGTEKVVGQGYESDMPGFEDTLSDQDILDVLAYIKSTWPDEVIEMHNGVNGG
ncbi:mono/diheme cytochrome c family protein [Shimia isoporae]|uniref:Mono/diheme cytochrome c family protein n=1 Tax=Shimia isoporae TaxID=647720 RepID=A0A4R1NAR5_9RHOB|nr:cytochrome c [Shimia isoporae]TCL00496.1 mono/diheme cytochrome c family protein [Shimia isoporae]